MNRLGLLILGIGLAAGGCRATLSSSSPPPRMAESPPPPPPSHQQPPPPVVQNTPPTPPPPPAPPPPRPTGPSWDSTGWTLLGSTSVSGRVDRDVIRVGKHNGRYDQLTLVVTNSELELLDLTVTFGNKNHWSPPNIRQRFREGQRTRVIDLPEKNRAIDHIDLHYANIPGGGKATVELWARDVQGAAQGPTTPQPPRSTAPLFDTKGWTLLGTQVVQGRGNKVDKDVIAVGKQQGRFDRLTMVVTDSDLELINMKVVFASGNHYSPKLRQVFKEGSRTRVIDLPAKNRAIDRIELEYSNVPSGGKAHVEIWGRDVQGKHQ